MTLLVDLEIDGLLRTHWFYFHILKRFIGSDLLLTLLVYSSPLLEQFFRLSPISPLHQYTEILFDLNRLFGIILLQISVNLEEKSFAKRKFQCSSSHSLDKYFSLSTIHLFSHQCCKFCLVE